MHPRRALHLSIRTFSMTQTPARMDVRYGIFSKSMLLTIMYTTAHPFLAGVMAMGSWLGRAEGFGALRREILVAAVQDAVAVRVREVAHVLLRRAGGQLGVVNPELDVVVQESEPKTHTPCR